MELLLDSALRKLLAVIIAAAATAAISLPLWRYFQVERLEAEGSPASLTRAIRVQPAKAALYNRLGHMLLFSMEDDAAQALVALERATAIDPLAGAYWVDLSLAREQRGDLAGAEQALGEARTVEPNTPNILWQEMNFALRRSQTERTLNVARRLLALSPEYTKRALPVLSEVAEPSILVTNVLPPSLTALTDAIEVFTRGNSPQAAEPVWTRLLALDESPSPYYIRKLLDWVLDAGNLPLAQRIWGDSIRRGWIAGDVNALNEPLYNGDFHLPLLNFGFDWRVIPHAEASVWIEARGPQPGQQSLCVEFSEGARADFAHVTHLIPVEPDTYYSLHGFLRTSRVSSRGGAFLRAMEIEPKRGQTATTLPVMGTGGWQEISLRLETGHQTHLVQLALVRPGVAPGDFPATGQVCTAALEWKVLGQLNAAGAPGAGR